MTGRQRHHPDLGEALPPAARDIYSRAGGWLDPAAAVDRRKTRQALRRAAPSQHEPFGGEPC